MYTPASFVFDDKTEQLEFIRQNPFATLVASGESGLMAMHLPVLVRQYDDQFLLQAHIAKNNSEFADCAENTDVLLVFNGANAYVSPACYPSKPKTNGRVVPTWNYAAVHVHGRLSHQSSKDWMLSHLQQMVEKLEQPRPDPWHLSDAPDDFVSAMVGQIVGLDINIVSIEAKKKLSQNRPVEDQHGVVKGLRNPKEPSTSWSDHVVAKLIADRLAGHAGQQK